MTLHVFETPGEQDVCTVTCPEAPGQKDVCIFRFSSKVGSEKGNKNPVQRPHQRNDCGHFVENIALRQRERTAQ